MMRFSLEADEIVLSGDADQMNNTGSFDFILDAVSAEHDVKAYIQLLSRDGNITLVGAPDKASRGLCLWTFVQGLSVSSSVIVNIACTAAESILACNSNNDCHS
jgi:alcohol dehydrogenase (NADP+)